MGKLLITLMGFFSRKCTQKHIHLLSLRIHTFLWSQAQEAKQPGLRRAHREGHRPWPCLAEQCWDSSSPAQAVPGKLELPRQGDLSPKEMLSTSLVLPWLHHPHVWQHHSLEYCPPQPQSLLALRESSWALALLRIRIIAALSWMDGAGVRNAGHRRNRVHKPGRTWQTHLLST